MDDNPRTLGIINITGGLFFSIIPSIMLFFVAPKLFSLYQESNVAMPNTTISMGLLYLTLFICLLNIIWGLYLIISKPSNKFFARFSVVLGVAAGGLGLLTPLFCIPTIIIPIYSLTNSL